MSLFQNSVQQKYLNLLDAKLVDAKYTEFKAYFGNPVIQENIRNSKEEQFQEGFLRELFVKILGYTLNPSSNFNLTTEYKNVKDSKKADGAILIGDKGACSLAVVGVIELKGTNTTDLGKIESQAFGYKNNQPDCVYVITSNFEKLRFYIDNAIEFIEFNLFTLTKRNFELLYLCLSYENIAKGIPRTVKTESVSHEDIITKKLYKDYSQFKRELHHSLVAQNPQFDVLTIFKKSQKLLDRFLFLFFAEDRQLLPPNSVRLILNDWKEIQDRDENVPLYNRFKKYFGYLNTGFKGKRYDVFPYNGGLFKPDEVLDTVTIDDELLYRNTLALSGYDFISEVDVNILGHIFENSLNELDEIKAQLDGQEVDKSQTRRKKDGVFYTPKYITKYIVENTIGKLCTDKKAELLIDEEEYTSDKKRNIKTKQALLEKLNAYTQWLVQLTICDPACGSGAFLNQALDFLITEHRYIDELKAKLYGVPIIFNEIEKSILENNLFGVDLNEESVEIAKLSLWLRTAQPNRKLNDLNNNIKCGNSLIDDPAIAGDKAFNWQKEFPGVFEKGGFDVVIGNPPYGASFSELDKEYISKKYASYQYKFESYLYFYERGVYLLKVNGFLSFITPELFLRLEKSENIRRFLYENSILIELKFCGENVFADVKVNSVILTLSKGTIHQKYFQVIPENGIPWNYEVSNWENTELLKIDYEISPVLKSIMEKIDNNSTYIGKLGEAIQGLTPYDSYRGHSKELINSRGFHFNEKVDESCGKWLDGKHINRYSLVEGFEWLRYGVWLAAPREKRFFMGPRLLFREVPGQNKRIQATYTENTYFHGHSITPFLLNENQSIDNLFVILGVANSTLLSWYTKYRSSNFSKNTFPKLNPKDIKELPIPKTILTDNRIVKLVRELLIKREEIIILEKKLLKYIKSQFLVKTLDSDLQNWYDMEFRDFVKILNIAITKAGGQKLKKNDEIEWMEVFENKREEILKIKDSIKATDREIDQLVYALYELTEEEIGIVEG